MFANLLRLISRPPITAADSGSVLEVNVRAKPVPFHQLWINAPTFALGLLATVVYYGRR